MRCGDALASVRQGAAAGASVQWRSRMPGASSVPPDDPVVVGGLLRSDLGAGGFEGDRGVVVPRSSVSCRGTRGKLPSGGNKNHFTSCLFLQRFVESEREFLNSLFFTNRSTFVLHGNPLSESLLVDSSILYSFFFLALAHFI